VFANECFDLVYCHFVLRHISESELEVAIPALAESLKPGGVLVFRETLSERDKIGVIKHLIEH
jgi:predicted SAM-dependent methyltransferase